MNITRNNYEQFFLLYADNELAAQEKAEVEAFVTINPDLRGELEMFNEAVLIPEPLVLADKSLLYRKDGCFIDTHNCEEVFILYHDNELGKEQREETEKFISNNKSAEILFTQILNARLKPEDISFGNKTSLYRREGKVRTFPLYWRAIAAAVIIMFCVYGGWSYLHRDQRNDIAKNNNTEKFEILTQPVPKPIDKKQSPLVTNKTQEKISSEDKSTTPSATPSTQQGLLVKKDVVEKQNSLVKDNNLTEVAQDRVVAQVPSIINDMSSPDSKVNEPLRNPDINAHMALNSAAETDPVVLGATPASFQEQESNKDNYVFYNVSEEKFKKSKVGIFLRKAKRVVGRNTFLSGSKGKIASIDATPAN